MVRLGTDGYGWCGWVRMVRLGTDGAVVLKKGRISFEVSQTQIYYKNPLLNFETLLLSMFSKRCRFEAGSATLDAEGFLHVLSGCRCISFRDTRLAVDLIPRHFPVHIHLDDQLVAFAIHGREVGCRPELCPATGLHPRTLESVAVSGTAGLSLA